MSLEAFLAFLVASAVLLAIPGPTILFVVGTSLARGRWAGLGTVPAVMLGDLVAMTASLAGLGALLAASATAFTVLKLVGAAYLVWLGIRMWRSPPAPVDLAAGGGADPGIRRHAFVVTALNPKSIAFFVAFVPQFIDPSAPLLPQIVVMEATFVLLAGLNAALYAVLAGRARRFARDPRVLRAFGRVGGSALIGAGALTAAARQA